MTDDVDGALFSFIVSAGLNPGANIAEIYFDDRTPLFAPPPQIYSQSAGVSFEAGGSNTPPELPSGNNANPAFVTTALLVAEASGNNATGLTVGEALILKLIYDAAFGFSDVLSAFDTGALRVGLHVRSLLNGQSDSFVSVSAVPIPAALPLFGTALIGIGFLSRRRRRGRVTA